MSFAFHRGCFFLFVLACPGVAVPWAAHSASSSAAAGRTHPDRTTNLVWETTEVALGAVPPEAQVCGNPLTDEHGWHYGLAIWTPGGKSIWLDGKFGPEFQDFVDAHVTDVGLQYDYAFSADGKHLAYGGRLAGKCLMVRDGKPGEAADDVSRPTFSPDGLHLAYEAQRDGKSYLVLDGVPGPPSDGVCGRIIFSPNSRRIAYVVRHEKKTCLVLNQKEQPDSSEAWNPVFSPDSRHVAYVSIKGFAVLDGRKGPDYPANACWGPVFSSDSRHFGYTLGQRAFIDWDELPLPRHGARTWYVTFSPDLKRWACIVDGQQQKQVFLDGHPGPVFHSAWGLTFSPDGRRFAYVAEVETNWWMVVDGKLEAEIDMGASSPCFSPDGRRLAYIAGRGPLWWMVVDGKPGPKFRGTRGSLGHLNSYEQELPPLLIPQFSPDSCHVAYAALKDGSWVVLLDGKPVGTKYEKIIPGGPSFHEDGSLEFLGLRKGVLYRVQTRHRHASRTRWLASKPPPRAP